MCNATCSADFMPLPANMCDFNPHRTIGRVIIKRVEPMKPNELDVLFGMPRVVQHGLCITFHMEYVWD